MKYFMVSLIFLVSCYSAYAMEEKYETPMIVQTRVGQIVTLPLCQIDKHTSVFHTIVTAPNELILQFVENEEFKNEGSLRTVIAKYRALKPGITAVRFGLYAQSMCKSLGFVSFTVEVK